MDFELAKIEARRVTLRKRKINEEEEVGNNGVGNTEGLGSEGNLGNVGGPALVQGKL